MKKIINTAIIALMSFSAIAQNTEPRSVEEFSKLEVKGGAQVILVQGSPTSVIVNCENEKDLSKVATVVQGKTLVIYNKDDIKDNFKVTVTCQNLDEINTSGAAYLKTDSTFNAESLDLTASGASKIKLDLITKTLRSKISGASTVELSGAAENHNSIVSGAATLKAYKLATLNAEVTASGASTVKISPSKQLTANVSGASSLKYMGNPTDKSINLTGAADVKQVDSNEITIRLHDRDTSGVTNKYKQFKDKHFDWDNDFHHWGGVELNLNGLMSRSGGTSFPATDDYMSINYGVHSLSWNLNIFEKDFHIHKDYVNFVTGIGFGFNSYQFKNPIRLNPDSSFTYYTTDSSITFNKNKLRTSYLQVPLLIDFNTSIKDPDKSFHIAIGVIGGVKLGSNTYRTFTINGYDYTEKRKDDYNINPFKLDATARIGYGSFTLFGTYSLTTLFENGKGVQANPFTLGVRIIPF